MRSRTRARETAFKYLFEVDVNRGESCPTPGEYLDRFTLSEEVAAYARVLMEGVLREMDFLNGALSASAENWRLERMAAVDRNVLRIGAWEILRSGEVPPQVSINEAVDLAKRYGSERSGSFVNGVLDHLMRTRGGGAAPAPPGRRDV